MQPLIGITSSLGVATEDTFEQQKVSSTYVRAIEDAGGIPIIIPLIRSHESLKAIYSKLNGILLTGGDDVEPKHYGEKPHSKLGAVTPIRDEVEIPLVKWAFTDDKPVMAICRGIQVMNVALGGTLWQDISSQCENAETHKVGVGPKAHAQLPHSVEFSSESKVAKILGATELKINSSHHQAINKLASSLVSVASSKDGLVEAVEGRGKRFFIGLQCHPETMYDKTDVRWLAVFKAFVAACS